MNYRLEKLRKLITMIPWPVSVFYSDTFAKYQVRLIVKGVDIHLFFLVKLVTCWQWIMKRRKTCHKVLQCSRWNWSHHTSGLSTTEIPTRKCPNLTRVTSIIQKESAPRLSFEITLFKFLSNFCFWVKFYSSLS